MNGKREFYGEKIMCKVYTSGLHRDISSHYEKRAGMEKISTNFHTNSEMTHVCKVYKI